MHAVVHNVVRSEPFTVLPQPKRLPKPDAPAEILLALAAQGAKIKIRKPNEDRVKRKQDWSYPGPGNTADWQPQQMMQQQQAMTIPVHGQMMQQPIPMPQSGFLPTTMPSSLPMPMPMPMHLQMPMTTGPFQLPIQAPAPMGYQQNWPMQPTMAHDVPHDMNFGGFQDPNQTYMFQGSNPQQHGYGNDYNNGNY